TYWWQDRYREAEPLYQRALNIGKKQLGSTDLRVAEIENNLARLYIEMGSAKNLLNHARAATVALIAHRGSEALAKGEKAKAGSGGDAVETRSAYFQRLIVADAWAADDGLEPTDKLANEAFVAAQWAAQSAASNSLAQMAARGARGDAALARIVRERQDLV